MRILILLISLLACTSARALVVLTPAYIDSVTYQYYLNEDWDQVIETGKQALQQGIDFKYLQQRMGYAYYQKSDYYAAMRHYEKALTYDPKDQGSLLYLYFAGVETGNAAYARAYAGKLSVQNKTFYHQKAFRPVSAIDYEYNYQWNSELNRSNPSFQRIGLNSELGYSFNLYQSFSRFKQNADYSDSDNQYRSVIAQNEYYLLLSKNFRANFGMDIGYHSIKTTFQTDIWDLTLNEMTETLAPSTFSGNLWFGDLHYKWNRMHLGLSTSYQNLDYNHVLQNGVHLGLVLPGSHNLSIYNSMYLMNDDYDTWLVSKHSIGMLFFKKYWLELSKTFGNLNNFADMNGMYLYNSFDPTLSRAGLSLFWYAGRQLTLYTNFTLETKQNTYLLNNYQQNALTGGIIWKL